MKHTNFLEHLQDEDTTSTHPSERIEMEEEFPDLTPPVFTDKPTTNFNDNFFQRCNKKFEQAINLAHVPKNEGLFYENISTAFSYFFFIDGCIREFIKEITCNYSEEGDFQSFDISKKQMKNAFNAYFEKRNHENRPKLIKEGMKAFDHAVEINSQLIENFNIIREALKYQKKFEKALISFQEKYANKSDEFKNEIFLACQKDIIKKLNSYKEKATLKHQHLGSYFNIYSVLYARNEFNAAIFAMKLSTGSTSFSKPQTALLKSLSPTFNEI